MRSLKLVSVIAAFGVSVAGGFAMYRMHETAEARAVRPAPTPSQVAESVRGQPGWNTHYRFAAGAEFEAGEWAQAAALLEEVVAAPESRHDKLEALRQIGLYTGHRDVARAERSYRAILADADQAPLTPELESTYVQAVMLLADLLAQRRRYDEALVVSERLLGEHEARFARVNGGGAVASVLSTRAMIFQKLERTAEAAAALRHAHERYAQAIPMPPAQLDEHIAKLEAGDDPQARLTLADAEYRRLRDAGSYEQFQAAHELIMAMSRAGLRTEAAQLALSVYDESVTRWDAVWDARPPEVDPAYAQYLRDVDRTRIERAVLQFAFYQEGLDPAIRVAGLQRMLARADLHAEDRAVYERELQRTLAPPAP